MVTVLLFRGSCLGCVIEMADYKFSSTDVQQAGLSAVVATINADRATQDPPLDPLSNQDYLAARIGDVLDSYASAVIEVKIARVADGFRADPAGIDEAVTKADAAIAVDAAATAATVDAQPAKLG